MGAYSCTVGHDRCHVRVLGELFEHVGPNTVLFPACVALEDTFPLAKVGWQFTPLCAGAQNPVNCFDETATLFLLPRVGTRVSLQKCLQPLPLMVGNLIGRHPTIVANVTKPFKRQRNLESQVLMPADPVPVLAGLNITGSTSIGGRSPSPEPQQPNHGCSAKIQASRHNPKAGQSQRKRRRPSNKSRICLHASTRRTHTPQQPPTHHKNRSQCSSGRILKSRHRPPPAPQDPNNPCQTIIACKHQPEACQRHQPKQRERPPPAIGIRMNCQTPAHPKGQAAEQE